MSQETKKALISLVITSVEKKIENLEESINHTNDGINDAPGANQSHSDTTKSQLTPVLETAVKSYEILMEDLKRLKSFSRTKEITNGEITLGALVVVKKQHNQDRYIILPGGSGVKVVFENNTYICITPTSPLTKLLIGKKVGSMIHLPHGKSHIEATIENVS